MLSYEECLDFSGLLTEEIEIIADHRGIPEMVAMELINEMLQTPKGVFALKSWMLEALEHAKLRGDPARTRRIDRVYDRFSRKHPTPRVL